jgi:hypothetical protein
VTFISSGCLFSLGPSLGPYSELWIESSSSLSSMSLSGVILPFLNWVFPASISYGFLFLERCPELISWTLLLLRNLRKPLDLVRVSFELDIHLLLLNKGLIAGAETVITLTKVSRMPQIVEWPIWDTDFRVRMQRSKAAVMMKRPDERKSPIMSLRRSGILIRQINGSGIASIPASVLFVDN